MWRRVFAPSTPLGPWCVRAFAVGLLGAALMWVAIGSGQRGGDTLTGNWWITAPALVAALGFVGAFVVGTITIIRDRERSVAVLVITTFGALVTLFLLGEVTNPH